MSWPGANPASCTAGKGLYLQRSKLTISLWETEGRERESTNVLMNKPSACVTVGCGGWCKQWLLEREREKGGGGGGREGGRERILLIDIKCRFLLNSQVDALKNNWFYAHVWIMNNKDSSYVICSKPARFTADNPNNIFHPFRLIS